MPKYRVFLTTGASLSVTVEAEDEEAAIEAAYDNDQYVCASCGGWGRNWSMEIGEWEPDDNPVELLGDADGDLEEG